MAQCENEISLIGNMKDVIEVRYLPNGQPVGSFKLATTDKWRDQTTQEIKEKTQWHRVIIFGNTAENMHKHLKKGARIRVKGMLEYRDWIDEQQIKRPIAEVIVRPGKGSIMFL